MNDAGLLIGILAAAVAVATGVLALASGRARKRRRYQEVPPAMRPGYSDEELEKTVLERWMGWGFVLTAFFAVALPTYWAFETRRIQETEQSRFVASVAEGEALYQANCAECHGTNAGGGAAPSPYSDDAWPAPNLRNIVERYEENPNVDDVRDHLIHTLERGIPGTPMPVYGMAFQGPFTDQEIEQVADWVLSQQDPPGEAPDDEAPDEEADEEAPEEDAEDGEAESASLAPRTATDKTGEELYVANCAQCHGPEGLGQVGPSLIGVTERHDDETLLGILRNGIYAPWVPMPAFQAGWYYEEARYDDEALGRIIDYLHDLQPDEIPDEFRNWQTPGVEHGPDIPPRPPEGQDAEDDDADTDDEDGNAQTAQSRGGR